MTKWILCAWQGARGVIWFFTAFFTVILVPLTSPSANARDTGLAGINLQNYSPATDPFGMWSVNSTRMLQPGTFYILKETNFSGGQLRIKRLGVPIDIMDQNLTTNFLVSLGITDYALIGVDMPFTSFLKSATTEIDDTVVDPSADTFTTLGAGDLRLFTKWRLFKEAENKGTPGLGLLVFSTIPSGDDRKFIGHPQASFGTSFIIDKTLPFARISFNTGVHLVEKRTIFGKTIGSRATFGAGISIPTQVFHQPLELIADVSGYIPFNSPAIDTSPVEYHLGVRKHFSNGFGLALAGGAAVNEAIGGPNYRFNLALFWKKPKYDRRIRTREPKLATPPPEDFEAVESYVSAVKQHEKPKLEPARVQTSTKTTIASQQRGKDVTTPTAPMPAPQVEKPDRPRVALIKPDTHPLTTQTVPQKTPPPPISDLKASQPAKDRSRPQKTRQAISYSPLYFDGSNVALTAHHRGILRNMLASYSATQAQIKRITIEAVEQGLNHDENNEADIWLPYRRTMAVKQALINMGVSEGLLVVRIINPKSVVSENANRRVSVKIES